jgi:hypothetical protein
VRTLSPLANWGGMITGIGENGSQKITAICIVTLNCHEKMPLNITGMKFADEI